MPYFAAACDYWLGTVKWFDVFEPWQGGFGLPAILIKKFLILNCN